MTHPADDAAAGIGLPCGLGGRLLDAACEVFVPWVHGYHLLPGNEPPQVVHHIPGVEVGDEGAPACADAFRPVNED